VIDEQGPIEADPATGQIAHDPRDRQAGLGLGRLIGRRLLAGAVTLFVVSVLVFLAGHLLPGDQAVAVLGRTATPERLAAMRHQLGLDRSLASQYLTWLKGILHGDFGATLAPGQSVATLIGNRLPNSLVLFAAVAVVLVPAGLFLGSLAAWKPGGLLDRTLSVGSVVAIAIPEFVVAVGLIYVLATSVFQLFPPVSLTAPGSTILSDPRLLVLPALTLIITSTPYLMRMIRAMMIEVGRTEYIEMARLKGVPEQQVLRRHALPNAIAPAAQVIALTLGYVIGGAVVIESVFAYPGIGLTLVDAIRGRDVATMQAIGLLIAAAYVILTVTADVIAIVVTPRLRTSASR